MSAEVAVAVVSWNTRDLLRACLESLAADADAGRAEVWVVDNGSDDGSPDLVRSEFPWVALVEPGKNLGFGPAVNVVAERTSAPWIAPSNADVALAPEALERLIEAGTADREAGAVAPRLVLPDGSTQHSVHHFPTVALSAAFGFGFTSILPGLGNRLCIEGHWDPEREREIDWAHGAFLLVRRAAWDAIGGFDPDQWMYAEDLDLAWRLHGAGWRMRYEPAARIRHEVSAATAQAFGDTRVQRYMDASYAWMARRRGMAVTWSFAAVNVVAAGVRWLVLWGPARVSPGRFGVRARTARAYVQVHGRGLRRKAALLEAR